MASVKPEWEVIIDRKISTIPDSYKLSYTYFELNKLKIALRDLIAQSVGGQPSVEDLQAFFNEYYDFVKTGDIQYTLIDSLYTYIPGEGLPIENALLTINPAFVQPESQGTEYNSYYSNSSQGGGKRSNKKSRKARNARKIRKSRKSRKTRNARSK